MVDALTPDTTPVRSFTRSHPALMPLSFPVLTVGGTFSEPRHRRGSRNLTAPVRFATPVPAAIIQLLRNLYRKPAAQHLWHGDARGVVFNVLWRRREGDHRTRRRYGGVGLARDCRGGVDSSQTTWSLPHSGHSGIYLIQVIPRCSVRGWRIFLEISRSSSAGSRPRRRVGRILSSSGGRRGSGVRAAAGPRHGRCGSVGGSARAALTKPR